MIEELLSKRETGLLFDELKEVLETYIKNKPYEFEATEMHINDLVHEHIKGPTIYKHTIYDVNYKKKYGVSLFAGKENYAFIAQYNSDEDVLFNLPSSLLVAKVNIKPFNITSIVYLEKNVKEKYLKANVGKINEFILKKNLK